MIPISINMIPRILFILSTEILAYINWSKPVYFLNLSFEVIILWSENNFGLN